MQYWLFICSMVLLAGCHGGSASQTKTLDMDSTAFADRANQLAQELIITDGHIDLPYRLNHYMEDVSLKTDRGEFDYVRAKQGGLDAPFMSIYVPSSYQETGGAKAFADSMISIVEEIADQHPDKFAIALNPKEVESYFQRGLVALPMGLENGAPIEENLDNVQYFRQKGISYITMTHAKDNQICDSSYDTTRTWNGLSEFGKQVVTEMNRVGIMIDVSHVSDSAFYQIMQITGAPAIASHSSCRHFTPGWERNMSDDMIKTLAENGGVIQINFGSAFLDSKSADSGDEINAYLDQWESEQTAMSQTEIDEYKQRYRRQHYLYSDVSRVADHIDHVVAIAGIDHVGFGSDFDGVGDSLPIGLKDVSQYPNLIAELLKRGYSEEDIAKICYQNVFRVWSQVLETAAI